MFRPLKTAIDLVSLSVRTAPKSGGIDDVFFMDATAYRKKIASRIKALGKALALQKADKELKRAVLLDWESDADVVGKSGGLILIGVDGKRSLGLNCGGCGFKNCAEFNKSKDKNKDAAVPGPFCVFKVIDLGIALGSAAKTLALCSVDNRIIYKIGVAAKKMKLTKVDPVVGIPLSATGKNIYFDRLAKLQAREIFKRKK